MKYTYKNAATIDRWVKEGWEWGQPISHEDFVAAKNGEWKVVLTPLEIMPRNWLPSDLVGKKILGLASGGGQQMPVFAALGAQCVVLDLSTEQLNNEKIVAEREHYDIETVQYDMTDPLPFDDETFDIIFHPVSNVYIEEVKPVFKECYRILKKGGVLVCGLDNGFNFATNDELTIENTFPFNPLKNPQQMAEMEKNDYGIQFSHTLSEQIGGQLEAGFTLTHIYDDINGYGRLHDLKIPTFFATRAVK